ncbi:MAG TPA: FHA domain-containing protein, partial [Planctomycetota bacterium]|nr:FHA domain-containing protein [Planctomycetota bacterium]
MALRIRIEHGQDAGTTWRLGAPGVYRFGRSPHGSVQVLDMKVSKEHFEIYVGAQNASLRDLGSTHGT